MWFHIGADEVCVRSNSADDIISSYLLELF